MQPSQEEFRDAYRDWRETRAQFERDMEAVVAGAPHDELNLQELADRMNSTYQRFIEAAKPFVGFRTTSG
jgi:hypothetical protein